MIRNRRNDLAGRRLPYCLTLELELVGAIRRHQEELVSAACVRVASIDCTRAFFVQADVIIQNRQRQETLGLTLKEGV